MCLLPTGYLLSIASQGSSRSCLNYKDEKESVIQGYIDKLGITFQSVPPVMFTEKEMKDFIEKWNKEKKHFFDSVLVMPQYVMPKVEE